MKPLVFSLLLMGYLQGCAGDTGTSFFLSAVVKPNPGDCTYTAKGDVLIEASGLFDPSFIQPYELVVAGTNLLDNGKTDEVTVAGGGPPILPETNVSVTLLLYRWQWHASHIVSRNGQRLHDISRIPRNNPPLHNKHCLFCCSNLL